MVTASDKDAIAFSLSSGQAGDSPEGRRLLESIGEAARITYLLMDRAYESGIMRTFAMELGYNPVVPPKSNRKQPWVYDKILYKLRNQVERLFRRIKRFRVGFLLVMISWILCFPPLSYSLLLLTLFNVNSP